MRTLGPIFLSSWLLLAACGDDGVASDAATDGATDAASDSGTDGATDAGSDAASDAGTDAGTDAATDAGTDASADAGACADCIDADLDWGHIGGFRRSTRSSTLSPCRTYTLTEVSRGTPPETLTCTNEVLCADAGTIEVSDVLAALAHPDVIAAFAAAPVTYGQDSRPVDGTIFGVSQSGAEFLVGGPCAGSASCVAIPGGVQALVDLLQAFEAERLALPDCSTVFPPA